MLATVKYQIATYAGEIKVPCEENDEAEHIIAKAKRILINKYGPFPLGYESWRVIKREDEQ
jgi:hypothetical protein